jgi:hypothetical protein
MPRACLGLVIFAVTRTRVPAAALGPLNVRSAVWIVPWLLGLLAIGHFGRRGSPNAIPNWWDLLLVAILAIISTRSPRSWPSTPDQVRELIMAEAEDLLPGEDAPRSTIGR